LRLIQIDAAAEMPLPAYFLSDIAGRRFYLSSIKADIFSRACR